jgi:uncharacterized membrane protein
MWGSGWGYWGWGWWFWVFWAFILFLIIWGIGWGWGRGGGTDDIGTGFDTESPNMDVEERILRRRYARGEITKEEFDQKVRDLRRAA